MAGRIKKIAKEVAKAGIASVVPGGAVVKAALDIKGASGKIACRKKGGKWTSGRCVMSPKGGPSKERRDKLTGTRTGKKKYPGVGDWYPEKG